MNQNKGLFVALAIFGVLVVLVCGMWYSCYKRHAQLHNLAAAQLEVNKVTFDKTWKVLQQQAGVTEQYKDSFKEIFVGMTEARYHDGGSGTLMKLIVESNPTFDASLFKQLMSSIEAQRNSFANEQSKLITYKNEHDNLVDYPPGSIFLDSEHLDITIVTSTKTEATFATGKEDDVNLFEKK